MMIFKEKFLKAPSIHLDVFIKDGFIVKSDLKAATDAAFFCTVSSDVDNQDIIDKILQWLKDYISKKNPSVSLPYLFSSSTEFQKKVYQSLIKIPLGKTRSYQDIALRTGSKLGARAVGNACNKNPFPLFIPCHRVIKKSMEIGGFALPIKLKDALLSFEKSQA